MNQGVADISHHVWETKYRYAHERTIADSWRRIARALAAVEPDDPAGWEARFLRILQGFKFLPGGGFKLAPERHETSRFSIAS